MYTTFKIIINRIKEFGKIKYERTMELSKQSHMVKSEAYSHVNFWLYSKRN